MHQPSKFLPAVLELECTALIKIQDIWTNTPRGNRARSATHLVVRSKTANGTRYGELIIWFVFGGNGKPWLELYDRCAGACQRLYFSAFDIYFDEINSRQLQLNHDFVDGGEGRLDVWTRTIRVKHDAVSGEVRITGVKCERSVSVPNPFGINDGPTIRHGLGKISVARACRASRWCA